MVLALIPSQVVLVHIPFLSGTIQLSLLLLFATSYLSPLSVNNGRSFSESSVESRGYCKYQQLCLHEILTLKILLLVSRFGDDSLLLNLYQIPIHH